ATCARVVSRRRVASPRAPPAQWPGRRATGAGAASSAPPPAPARTTSAASSPPARSRRAACPLRRRRRRAGGRAACARARRRRAERAWRGARRGSHVLAAVDVELGAGDPVALGAEEPDEARDLVGLAEAADRNASP